VSSEAQRVSAAFTSGVNPKIADCCCLSLVAQHDRSGPCFSRSAGGEARGNLATDDNVNPRGPAVDLAEALRAGWFELWYQPKIGSQAQDLRGRRSAHSYARSAIGNYSTCRFHARCRRSAFPGALAICHRSSTRRLALFLHRATSSGYIDQSSDLVYRRGRYSLVLSGRFWSEKSGIFSRRLSAPCCLVLPHFE
jgi:hypothetical protein